MTRRSDLMCEDLFGCDHDPETPLSNVDGEIYAWLCRCGSHQCPADVSGKPVSVPSGGADGEKR